MRLFTIAFLNSAVSDVDVIVMFTCTFAQLNMCAIVVSDIFRKTLDMSGMEL